MDRETFEELFKEEHRTILETIEQLTEKLRNSQNPNVESNIRKLNELLGPHFRYEEETLYPSLQDRYGRIYVKRLYDSHEGTIHTVRKLMDMVENTSMKTNEGLDLVYGWLLPHVSDCEGLSIMVDQIPEDAIDEIAEAREKAREEGLDLLTWADRKRERPEFGTLTIFN